MVIRMGKDEEGNDSEEFDTDKKIKELTKTIKFGVKDEKQEALNQLKQFGSVKVIEVLLDIISDKDTLPRTKKWAIEKLEGVGGSETAQALAQLLHPHSAKSTKRKALQTIIESGDKESIPSLKQAYKTESSKAIREDILEALKALGISQHEINQMEASKELGKSDKSSSLITLSAIIASLLCFVAGIWMLNIKGGGETPTIFESAFHAAGVYFIAKGFFVGPALYHLGKKS